MFLFRRRKKRAKVSREKLIERGWERIELGPEDKKIMQRFSKSLRRQREVHRKALNLLKDFLKGNPKLLERLEDISGKRPWFALRDLKSFAGKYLLKEKLIVIGSEVAGRKGRLDVCVHELMHHILMEYVLLSGLSPSKVYEELDEVRKEKGIKLPWWEVDSMSHTYHLLMLSLREALPEAVTIKISGRTGMIKGARSHILSLYVSYYWKDVGKKTRAIFKKMGESLPKKIDEKEVEEEIRRVIARKKEIRMELEKLIDSEKMERLLYGFSRRYRERFTLYSAYWIGELIARSFEKDEILELISKHPIEAVEFVFNNRERLMETIEKLDCPEFVKLFLRGAMKFLVWRAERILKHKEMFRDLTDRLLEENLQKYL